MCVYIQYTSSTASTAEMKKNTTCMLFHPTYPGANLAQEHPVTVATSKPATLVLKSERLCGGPRSWEGAALTSQATFVEWPLPVLRLFKSQ